MPTLGSSAGVHKKTIQLCYYYIVTVIFISRMMFIRYIAGKGVIYNPTREEDEHLVRGVVVVRHQHGQVRSSRATLAGFITELALKLIQRLIQLVLCHQVASIVAQLIARPSES